MASLSVFQALAASTKTVDLRQKAAIPPLQPLSSRGGWYSLLREPFQGAWQRNNDVNIDTILTYPAVFSCIRLISTDIGKLTLKLVEQDEEGVWVDAESPAFSPFLREPNKFQTINQFVEQWVISGLIHGNTYALKSRDMRGVVTAAYVLDPTRVTPMVSPDGSIFYELKRDDLSRLYAEKIVVPESEIFHDRTNCFYHPLVGISPLYACGTAATQGLSIQGSSTSFFENRSTPNGILTAPVGITDEQAAALKANWQGLEPGDIAVLAGDLKFQALSQTAVESQLTEQLQKAAETVCSAFGVPPYLVDIGPPPPYANFEPLVLKYHSQCIQSRTTHMEKVLDRGLGLIQRVGGKQLGTYFDIDDLIWMDNATRVTSAQGAITSGGMAVNEARRKYHGLPKTDGGEFVYMQQQQWPLHQLADRQPPASAPAVAPPPVAVEPEPEDEDEMDMAAAWTAIRRKSREAGFYAA